ncbi:MAG: OmpH family outer membrane protein [Bacteroidales bacterium]|nr:OmpH family outer membrane protein [Bacteroidales bacterium]
MKKVLFFIALAVTLSSFAQTKQKFGHINSNDLLMAMPDNKQASDALKAHSKELENQLMAMQAELEQKYNDYLTKKDSLSPLIQKTKESELNDLNMRIQSFQQTAQQDLQQKEAELMQPIIEKARNAIREVSKEKEYTYVFDTSTGALVFWPEESDDILPLVKAKLGIQ